MYIVVSGKKILTKAGLQIRMTVFITSAVLLISAIVLLIMAIFIRKSYESLMDERISDDLAAITQNIEQRMLRMEDATKTMASIAPPLLGRRSDIDSLLVYSLGAIEDIQSVSMVFRDGFIAGEDGIFVRYAHFDAAHNIVLSTIDTSHTDERNHYWQEGYVQGKSFWTEPAQESASGKDIICCYVPLNDTTGERIGITGQSAALSDLTSFVTQYKVREDIDISIYTSVGTMVVAPDDYILDIPQEDLITRELTIDHLGWKVILSADRSIIDKEVRKALLSIALLILLMFLVITLAIRVTVRHVAKPFVERQQQVEKENAVMDNELMLAAGAQQELIPHTFPPFPNHKGIDIAACLHPARDVGGDLYDYFVNDDHLYFCIGDVSGKGLQASLFMAATHYLFRSVAAGMPASDAVKQMNISLCTDNEKCRFVTFWFGCLDLATGELEYVNAGHDAPVIVRDGKVDTFPSSENISLGIWDEADFVSRTTNLIPGDMLLLYTDGITEAMDINGCEFGRKKLFEAVGTTPAANASDVIDSMLRQVRQHASGAVQSDDITMLCIKYLMNEIKS